MTRSRFTENQSGSFRISMPQISRKKSGKEFRPADGRREQDPKTGAPPKLDAAAPALAVLLLAILATQAMMFMSANSRTSDETAHMAAGYSYLKLRDFRLNPEHPPLIKELAAVPLLFLNLRFPTGRDWEEADQWGVGRRFFYEQRELTRDQTGSDTDHVSWKTMLFSARLPVLALSLALGWFLFCWSREMFGAPAALLALALYVLDPNIVAHSSLVTTDLGVTLFMFLSIYALWKYSRRPHPLRILVFGLMIGAAFASKFTALWLLPIFAMLALFLLFSKEPLPARPWSARSEPVSGFGRRFGALALVFGAALAIGSLALLASYFVIYFPAFLEGMRVGFKHSQGGHWAYLLGSISLRGWWDYFFIAFAVKSPPGTLLLLAAALAPGLPFTLPGPRQERLVKGIFLWAPVAAILAITAAWSINIGLRHILPAYPFLFMAAGSAAARKPSYGFLRNLIGAAIIVGISWNALEAVKITPWQLAYFNPFAGGPVNGPHYLSDSNIDWGQSTEALKRYVDRAGVPAIYCAFAADRDPWIHGVRYQYVPGPLNLPAARNRGFQVPRGMARELLAIEVLVTQGLYLSDPEAYAWLRSRTPIDRIGYSILVYDITRDDMAHVHIAYGCFGYKLYDLAEREARRALEINPTNSYAARLLAALGQAREIAPSAAPRPSRRRRGGMAPGLH